MKFVIYRNTVYNLERIESFAFTTSDLGNEYQISIHFNNKGDLIPLHTVLKSEYSFELIQRFVHQIRVFLSDDIRPWLDLEHLVCKVAREFRKEEMDGANNS
jgi:hypothetical protein